MSKFNNINKSRKKSKDIDEKIEYLNNECQKTGLQEIMSTSGMYQGTTKVPNQDYDDFSGLSQGGYGFGLSADDGNSLGGALNGDHPSTGLSGVALSPPHPVTGVRRVASTVTDGVGSNRSLRPGIGTRVRGTNDDGSPRIIKDGGALWFWDPNYSLGGIQGRWRNLEWFDGELGFWDTNFLGFFFHNTNLDQFQLSGVNIGTEIKNKIAGINFGTNGNLPPETIVLTQNDLGDPSFTPIHIGEMSPEAYNYLDTASSGYSDDTYNWYVKTYGAGAAGWYMNNPNSDPSNNPFLKPGDYTPFTDRASNPNTGASSVDNTGTLPDGTQIAGNYGDLKNWEKSILQNGLKVKSGASYERELRRLQQMYPGFIPQA